MNGEDFASHDYILKLSPQLMSRIVNWFLCSNQYKCLSASIRYSHTSTCMHVQIDSLYKYIVSEMDASDISLLEFTLEWDQIFASYHLHFYCILEHIYQNKCKTNAKHMQLHITALFCILDQIGAISIDQNKCKTKEKQMHKKSKTNGKKTKCKTKPKQKHNKCNFTSQHIGSDRCNFPLVESTSGGLEAIPFCGRFEGWPQAVQKISRISDSHFC